MSGRTRARGTKESQATKRAVALRMLASGDYTHTQIARVVGVASGTVSGWAGAKKRGKINTIPKKRGRPRGVGKALKPAEERRLRAAIRTRTPDQLKLPFALWSIGAIMRYAAEKLGKSLPESTVRKYLGSWGFTIQRPKTRAHARDDVVIERWLAEIYPQIHARAKAEGAEIHWLDETGVDSQTVYSRGFAPKGVTPVLKKAVGKMRISVISTVNNQGKMRFMTYEETLKVPLFLRFLQQLVRDADRKIFLIADNLRVHKATAVKKWLESAEIKEKIEIFYLPPYAPEFNPDEYLNNDLKQNVHVAGLPKDKRTLKSTVRAKLAAIQKNPARVRSYFQAADTLYAAA